MGKRILAIYYTQSGQMRDIINSFTAPLAEAGVAVEKVQVKMASDFAFPWTGSRFFSVMPDCVLDVPAQLEDIKLQHNSYDLVILGYQPWFLSPSIPSNSILNHPDIKVILQGTPVITISEARNMWLNAYDRIRKKLKDAGANLVGNIALVDKHPNFVSFVTIFYWMLTGKKGRYLNLFPKPGVADEDITNARVFGNIVQEQLQTGEWDGLQEKLLAQKAAVIKYPLMLIESKAKIIFAVWAKFIAKRKNRGPWISAFKYYLFVALFLGAPILITLDAIFIKPFSSKRIKAKKQYYLQVI